jgi:nucleotide-binding universal stress UspA family protein
MNASHEQRVFLGVGDSVASLEAVRVAVREARRRDATLYAIRVWNPSAAAGTPDLARMREVWQVEAWDRAEQAFDEAMGGFPHDIGVRVLTPHGVVGALLTRLAGREDDLLVVGTGRSGWLHRLLRGSISRYCLARAHCPVLVVPPHAMIRQVRQVSRLTRGRRDPWRELASQDRARPNSRPN